MTLRSNGYLATVFSDQFFPSDDKLASLIGAYAVFAIGFLARPLGGVIYGYIGDRFGRRRLLTMSVVLMGCRPSSSDFCPRMPALAFWRRCFS